MVMEREVVVISMLLLVILTDLTQSQTKRSEGMVVSVDTSTLLSCSSPDDQPWLLCVWVSPTGLRTCALQGDTRDQCSHTRADMVINSTSDTLCQLGIVTRTEDHGTWTCMMTLANLDNMVSRLSLSVHTPPQPR